MSDVAAARGYLLGELTDERSTALEQAVLVDRHLQELIEEVEHDLIDDYVDDRLSAAERARFEQHYMTSTLHRDRVAVARALMIRAREGEARHESRFWSRPWGWAAAALLAIAMLQSLVEWWSSAENPNVPAVAEAPSTPVSPVAPAPSGECPTAPVVEPMRVAVVLPAVATRSRTATTPRVILTPGVAFVDLLLEGSAAGLVTANAEVRSVDDRAVWTGTSTPPSAARAGETHTAMVSIPADRLPADDYILTLTDQNAKVVARYFFRVALGR